MFLTSGMKVKKIRKDLKLKQSEIVDNSITRNLVSAIENDKVPLTYNAASVISKVINEYCRKNGINYSVDINYLMEPYEKQVLKYILNIYNKSKEEEFLKKAEELIKLAEEHELLNEEVKLLKKQGEIYYERTEYMKAEFIFLKAFYKSFRLGNNILYGELLLNLTRNNYVLHKYKENIELISVMKDILENIPNFIKMKISYNKAISYIELDKQYEAIEELKKVLSLVDPLDTNTNLHIKKTLIQSYLKVEEYDQAELIAIELEKNINNYDEEDKILIYYIFLRISVSKKEKSEILKNIRKVMEYINYLIDENYMSVDIYQNLGKGNFYLGNLEQATYYLKKALLLAVKHNIQGDQLNIVQFILMSGEKLNLEEIEYIENIFLKKFSKGMIEKKHRIELLLIKYYSLNNLSEKRENFIDKLLKHY